MLDTIANTVTVRETETVPGQLNCYTTEAESVQVALEFWGKRKISLHQ